VHVCANTGSGKSAIPLTAGSLLSRVILTLVPLVGFGSDQVSKIQDRGSSGKNVFFSNGPNSTSECFNLLY
jgi:hypothetical protein